MNLAGSADAILIAKNYDLLNYVQEVINWFESHNMDICSERPEVDIVPTPSGGIRIVGLSNMCSER